MDETHQHNAPPEGESHSRLLVVSDRFADLKPLARQRLINGLLAAEFANGLHALAMHTWTPVEWFDRGGGSPPESPPCLGGGKTDDDLTIPPVTGTPSPRSRQLLIPLSPRGGGRSDVPLAY